MILRVIQPLLQFEDYISHPHTNVLYLNHLCLLGMKTKVCNNAHSSRLGRGATFTRACSWWFCKLCSNFTTGLVQIISHPHLQVLYFTITVFWVRRQFHAEIFNNAHSNRLGRDAISTKVYSWWFVSSVPISE